MTSANTAEALGGESIDNKVNNHDIIKEAAGIRLIKKPNGDYMVDTRSSDSQSYRGVQTLYDGKIEGTKDTVTQKLQILIEDAYDTVISDKQIPAAINSHERSRARLTHLMANLCSVRGYKSPKTMAEYEGGLSREIRRIAKECHDIGYIRRDIQPGYMK